MGAIQELPGFARKARWILDCACIPSSCAEGKLSLDRAGLIQPQPILSMDNLGRLCHNSFSICIQIWGIMLNLLIHFHSKVQLAQFA
ncbi:hypothetical protein DUI87_24590 [Hirundo rustica rustica]|uniref:Uncharacterized protein n=1 Tax=Hirundo rustica rustica TaxID=333673 RepID=A0A3M0JE15_HIRRU|nr:hypothetical protein DUI87_24590 [Hirundo rustica rustica]